MSNWIEGSWDKDGNRTGVPSELDDDGLKDRYIWITIALRSDWGMIHPITVANSKSVLRSMSAYHESRNEPFPRWMWKQMEVEPDKPEWEEK